MGSSSRQIYGATGWYEVRSSDRPWHSLHAHRPPNADLRTQTSVNKHTHTLLRSKVCVCPNHYFWGVQGFRVTGFRGSGLQGSRVLGLPPTMSSQASACLMMLKMMSTNHNTTNAVGKPHQNPGQAHKPDKPPPYRARSSSECFHCCGRRDEQERTWERFEYL